MLGVDRLPHLKLMDSGGSQVAFYTACGYSLGGIHAIPTVLPPLDQSVMINMDSFSYI